MSKLYEDIVSRSATYRDTNEKILSAYDKMLMNEGNEKTSDIRTVLKKELGLTNRDVSVRMRSGGGSIGVTLKTTKALPYMQKIKEVSEKHESYQRDQATGTILRGGNTFVFVELDWKFRSRLVKQIEAEINKKVTDEFMNGEGGGNTITVYGNYDVYKDRQSIKDEFRVVTKSSSAGPPQYSIIEAAGRVLHLMIKNEDIKALKKLK